MHKKRILMAFAILFAVLTIFICGFYIYFLFVKNTPQIQAKVQTLVDVASTDAVKDGDTISTSPSPTQPPAQPLRLIVSAAPTFDKASIKGVLNIANHKDNKDLILQVKLVNRANPDEIYYISPVLQPDQHIETDYLKKQDLTSGDYDCLAIFDFYNISDSSHYYSTATGVVLHIEN